MSGIDLVSMLIVAIPDNGYGLYYTVRKRIAYTLPGVLYAYGDQNLTQESCTSFPVQVS